MPGLGRQPQAPSSAAPAALPAAAPGVRSEPRPALAPAPNPPPRGGSVKPGGEGGGGGSPTRDGAGGGGPAGGELAANTFPMVACKRRGQRAEVRARTPWAQPQPTLPCSGSRFSLAAAPAPGLGSAPTPCATRNRTRCCRRRHRCSAPPSPLVQCALRSTHRPHGLDFLLESWMEIPPIPLQCPFFIGFHAQEGQPNFLPFPLAYGARAYWLVTTRV